MTSVHNALDLTSELCCRYEYQKWQNWVVMCMQINIEIQQEEGSNVPWYAIKSSKLKIRLKFKLIGNSISYTLGLFFFYNLKSQDERV